MDTDPVYHVVSQTHWDREWTTSAEESRALLTDFMADLFALFDADPEFRAFTLDGETTVVTDFLETEPAARGRFTALVRDGRLRIGPWYTLADEFLPSGEAHVRNLAEGLRLCGDIGPPLRFGYLPDQFGHIAQMPQILRGFGIAEALIYRGFGGDPGQESSEYLWRAPDGSDVLAFHLPKDGYSFAYFAGDDDEAALHRFARIRAELDGRARSRHRLVVNGGDHHWPDARLSHVLRLLRERGVACVHTSLDAYARAVRDDADTSAFPVLAGETRRGFRHAFAVVGGTASSRIWVKRENAHCQELLETLVEPLNALAALESGRDRSALVRRAWRTLLENQVHDVICGSSVDRVYLDARARFARCRQLAVQTLHLALDDLVPRDPRAHGDDRFVFAFNTLPRSRAALVECDFDFHLQDVVVGINPDQRETPRGTPPSAYRIRDAEGGDVPFQVLRRGETFALVPARKAYPQQILVERDTVLFDAGAVPAMGYARFTVERAAEFPAVTPRVRVEGRTLENAFVRVTVEDDGTLTVEDRVRGTALRGMHVLEDGGDIGDCYSYCFPERDRIVRSDAVPNVVTVVERGPLRAALVIRWTFEIPVGRSAAGEPEGEAILPVATRVSLEADSRRVELRTTVENRARDHRLRAVFPTGLRTAVSTADAQFALVRREHRAEDWSKYPIEKPLNLEVMQRFVAVEDDVRGCAIHAKGLPEYELATDGSGTLSVTLLRAVGELSKPDLATRPGGDAGWKNATPDAQCPGVHVFEYAIELFDPSHGYGGVLASAEEYRTRVVTTNRKHETGVPARRSWLSFDGPGLVWSAFKTAVDGDGVVVRWYNPDGAPRAYRLVPAFSCTAVTLCDLEERSQSGTGTDAGTGEVPGFRIVSVRLRSA